MPESISKPLKKLVVISDTAMCVEPDGMYAFGPVVKELESFTFVNQITWIGFHKKRNSSFIKVSDKRLKLIPLTSTGGNNLWSKCLILLHYPVYFCVLFKHIFNAEVIHVRAPSNPSVIAYLLSWIFPRKQFWFKYAGNWVGDASWFYRVQRTLLTIVPKNVKVTINGSWPNQKKHICSFENPCLTASDREQGEQYITEKQFPNKFNFCFIGNLDDNKGIELLIHAFKNISSDKVDTLHIVGGGKLEQWVKNESAIMGFKTVIHGFLPKDDIKSIYKLSHFIVLPSKSEGFPKVIGEAMNYGTIPVISDISCIDQYISHNENGYLINSISVKGVTSVIEEALKLNKSKFIEMLHYNYSLSNKFTYAYYQQQIITKVVKS